MEYTIEIEEAERTLEFVLDVNIWEDRLCECACIEFNIEKVHITTDTNDFLNPVDDETFINDHTLFYLIEEAYKSKIENMLDEDEKLFEAWKKHVESI